MPRDNPPGAPINGRQIDQVESTMNATIRECVFVTEHLDAGDMDAATDALIQINMNVDEVLRKLTRIRRKAAAVVLACL